jgi:hypothetical protein
MLPAVAARLARLRQPASAARLARSLWIAWAIVLWNVIFDRVLVVAGRSYVYAAARAAKASGPYLRVDDWMKPAMTHGLWLASIASTLLLLAGFAAISAASRPSVRRMDA